jgi:hypothetical protein
MTAHHALLAGFTIAGRAQITLRRHYLPEPMMRRSSPTSERTMTSAGQRNANGKIECNPTIRNQGSVT